MDTAVVAAIVAAAVPLPRCSIPNVITIKVIQVKIYFYYIFIVK
jgi:hypothetical protein